MNIARRRILLAGHRHALATGRVTRSALLSIGLAALGANGLAFASQPTPSPLDRLISNCLACHGSDNLRLDPTYPIPKIGLQHSDYLVLAMNEYKSGQRDNAVMHSQMAALSNLDIQALADYFGGEALPPPADRPPPRPDSHPAKLTELCGACHGETGLGNMPGYPVLTGQYADYLRHALIDYRLGHRKHPFMPRYASSLNDQEMTQLVDYFSLRNSLTVGLAPIEQALQSIRMTDIPAGDFLMGTDVEDFNMGRPQHLVHIKAFRLARYSVTFEQYDAFARATGRAVPPDDGWGRSRRPAINITWQDTQDFIAWLNQKTGRYYRLPSEAEREYATRAGTSTNYWWGDQMDPEHVNAQGVGGRDRWEFTAPVGQFPPNPFGLYDMSGNVWERTGDCWHWSYTGAPSDGSSWQSDDCHEHIIRGGYWGSPRLGAYSRYRAIAADSYASGGLSFRLAEDKTADALTNPNAGAR